MALVVGLGIGNGYLGLSSISLAQDSSSSSKAQHQASGHRSTQANDFGANVKILQKLDQILANQEAILKRFDDVMEELRIVKVRATN